MKLYEDAYHTFEVQGKVNDKTPVFIMPPFAGRGGSVTDNLMAKCVAEGRTTYRYELKSATHETRNLSINGLIHIIRSCHEIIAKEHDYIYSVDLLGVCMGGWLSAIYSAFYPDDINRLALFAAPINTRTGCGNAIEKYCEKISLPTHQLMVDMNGGIQAGLWQWLAFAAMAPEYVYYGRYADLAKLIAAGDDKGVTKWRVTNAWYDSTRDLAGKWFIEALDNHFANNRLYDGTWLVGGYKVNLSNITCPVYVYAGGDDIITSQEQTKGILDKVSSTDKHFTLFPGAGHTKCFAGRNELAIFAKDFFH